MGWPLNGNSRVYYAGDTMVGGIAGQRLGAVSYIQNWGDTSVYHTEQATGMITSFTNGIVSVWSMDSLTWDTLFWFSALPGDRWHEPHASIIPGNPTEWIEVVDTATVIIDSVPLRQLTVEQVCDGVWVDWGGQITERIGYWTPFYFPPTCGTESGIWQLVCYNDSTISHTSGKGCAYLLGTNEPMNTPFAVFPNPVENTLNFSMRPGPPQRVIINAPDGRVVHRQTMVNNALDVSDLEPGTYVLRLLDPTGHGWARFIKR